MKRTVCLIVIFAELLGCQSSRSTTIAEYRPRTGPVERPAPFSDVYLLYRWVPDPSPKASSGSAVLQVVRQRPVEIGMSYAAKGSPVGFRRSDGRLIGIAGSTTQSLEESHYTWQTLAGVTSHMNDVESAGPIDDDTDDPVVHAIFGFIGDYLSGAFEPDDCDTYLDSGSSTRHQRSSRSHGESRSPHGNKNSKMPTSRPSL